MLVYLITNLINGKRYVGQTSQPLSDRWRRHRNLSKDISKHSVRLYNAIRKYGVDNFEIEVLAEVSSKEEMNYFERKFIGLWNLTDDRFGYNISEGGAGVNRPCSEETKRKISSTLLKRSASGVPSHNLGLKRTEETRKKLSEAHKGNKHSEETKRKMSEAQKLAQKDRVFSEEHLQNLSLASQKRWKRHREGSASTHA